MQTQYPPKTTPVWPRPPGAEGGQAACGELQQRLLPPGFPVSLEAAILGVITAPRTLAISAVIEAEP